MSEFIVSTESEWLAFVSQVVDMREETGKPVKLTLKSCSIRSLNQNAFQHVIYKNISDYLISKGRTDWSPEFVKKNLKNKFLGWIDEEYIDIHSGEATCKSVLMSTSKLDKGDSFNFTTAILEWSESIGCHIEIPSNCEYMELMKIQNM